MTLVHYCLNLVLLLGIVLLSMPFSLLSAFLQPTAISLIHWSHHLLKYCSRVSTHKRIPHHPSDDTNKPDQGQGHIVFGWIDHPVPQYSVRSLSLIFILYAITPPTPLLPSAGVLRGGGVVIIISRKLVV